MIQAENRTGPHCLEKESHGRYEEGEADSAKSRFVSRLF
jgi:hypothetical protein